MAISVYIKTYNYHELDMNYHYMFSCLLYKFVDEIIHIRIISFRSL